MTGRLQPGPESFRNPEIDSAEDEAFVVNRLEIFESQLLDGEVSMSDILVPTDAQLAFEARQRNFQIRAAGARAILAEYTDDEIAQDVYDRAVTRNARLILDAGPTYAKTKSHLNAWHALIFQTDLYSSINDNYLIGSRKTGTELATDVAQKATELSVDDPTYADEIAEQWAAYALAKKGEIPDYVKRISRYMREAANKEIPQIDIQFEGEDNKASVGHIAKTFYLRDRGGEFQPGIAPPIQLFYANYLRRTIKIEPPKTVAALSMYVVDKQVDRRKWAYFRGVDAELEDAAKADSTYDSGMIANVANRLLIDILRFAGSEAGIDSRNANVIYSKISLNKERYASTPKPLSDIQLRAIAMQLTGYANDDPRRETDLSAVDQTTSLEDVFNRIIYVIKIYGRNTDTEAVRGYDAAAGCAVRLIKIATQHEK